MTDKKSEKTAYDYAELGGLRISESNLKVSGGNPIVIQWVKDRIAQLNKL